MNIFLQDLYKEFANWMTEVLRKQLHSTLIICNKQRKITSLKAQGIKVMFSYIFSPLGTN